ncbi:type VI secretion system tube protein TssD [Aquimarina muelleri]|uniref:type VI secretion system tube protein TssD n=1 Tax=Aquimarina muelleri TaxID=279356 RepID=UPI003F6864C5
MGILAKLTIFGQVRELQNCTMLYQTLIDKKGKPAPMVLGGLIECTFITGYNEEVFLYFMQMPSVHNKKNEDFYYLSEGEVVFYFNSFDNPPLKRYKFNDAAIVEYREVFATNGETPMLTTITISPAIQDYGHPIIRRWNKSYIPPSKQQGYQALENTDTGKKLTEYYITDLEGNELEEFMHDTTVLLHIKTENRIGDIMDIKLRDKIHDFKYKGQVLENDTLKDIVITSELQQIELEVIYPLQES